MASVLDCAALAQDVYDRVSNTTATNHGWTRIDAQNWSPGFAAGIYRKGDEIIVAYRGTDTDDPDDILSDAQMVPPMLPGASHQTLTTLLRRYGVSRSDGLAWAPLATEGIVRLPIVRDAIRLYANRVPQTQSQEALSYFNRCTPAPSFVVGHSLGGALAKTISLRKGVPAVTFNSPHMGDLRGIAPLSSPLILSVNTDGDPLSLATKGAGNLSHGREILVTIPRAKYQKPQRPRRPSAWLIMLFPVPAMLWHARNRAGHEIELLEYVGKNMGYYHSMANLLKEIEAQGGRFRRDLEDGFINL